MSYRTVAATTLRRLQRMLARLTSRRAASRPMPGRSERSQVLFDAVYYTTRYPDVAAAGIDPWDHYRRFGRAELRQPSAVFDPQFYVDEYPDVANSGLDPLTHFLETGGGHGYNPVPVGFDSAWYLEQHPEVAESGENPLLHFLVEGVHNDWDPSPEFDLRFYRKTYPDVADSGMNPLVHFLQYGQAEGRITNSDGPAHRPLDSYLLQLAPDLTPLKVVTGPSVRRITLVTDSIGPDSLFGGVATALVLATLWSVRTGRTLRIATRHAAPEGSALGHVFATLGIRTERQPELVHAPAAPGDVLEVGDDDLFLTTSWWSTAAVLKSIPADRVAYILQEDERSFYPLGGSSVRAAEIMNHPDLTVLVNTSGLYEDLIRTGITNLRTTGTPFEPSFASFYEKGRQLAAEGAPRTMFVYARPHNVRNLFELTLTSLDRAIEDGHLPEAQWRIHLVGRDVPAITFSDGRHAVRPGVLNYSEYKAMLGTIDLGLSLMASPHPSYPPLDLAAAGSFVVTNTWPGKPDLSASFDRILMAEPTVDALADAIGRAVRRLDTEGGTPFAAQDTHFVRPWSANLEASVERLARTFGDV